MLMDRAGWHRTKDLVVPDNLTLVLLPARAPELNPVENIWQFLRNSGKTGGGSVVFASLTRLPLILWRDGSTG
jgi:transposase